MSVPLIIPGGPWTIFTWVITLMVTGIHRGITRIIVIIPRGIGLIPIAIMVITVVITMDGDRMIMIPEAVMNGTQAMITAILLTAETAVARMKMATKFPAIVVMTMAGVATEHRP